MTKLEELKAAAFAAEAAREAAYGDYYAAKVAWRGYYGADAFYAARAELKKHKKNSDD